MLATMGSSQYDRPVREHSHLDLHGTNGDAPSENLGLEDRLCPGCKKSAVNEQGGLVVAFGQSFFHVDCFKCAKCGDQVTADTNLLLLSDGSPICANCSYSCNVCHLPILDEAIMTGDDSYHAHCFKCKVCKSRIDELVFAKTSQGIYCMNCHNERMIRMRKHTQKKAERERAGGSGSSKSRDREARHRENAKPPPATDGQPRPGSSRSQGLQMSSARSEDSRPGSSRGADGPSRTFTPAKSRPEPSTVNSSDTNPRNSGSQPNSRATPLPSPSGSSFPQQPLSVNVAPPFDGEQPPPSYTPPVLHSRPSALDAERSGPVKQSTLPIPAQSSDYDQDGRRRSYDDGVRPLHVLMKQSSLSASSSLRPDTPSSSESNGGLAPSTSRREKRQSINPGFTLPNFNDAVASQSSATLSPRSESFHTQPVDGSLPSPPYPGHEISRAASPHLELRSGPPSPRPISHSSSIHSYHSFSSHHPPEQDQRNDSYSRSRSRSPSFSAYDDGQDQTIVVKSPPNVMVNAVPPSRVQSPPGRNGVRPLPIPGGPQRKRGSDTLSPTDSNPHYSRPGDEHRPGSTHRTSSTSSHRSTSASRSASPAYRADVPHSIESGTDTEAEVEVADRMEEHRSSLPPAPPPKDEKESSHRLSEITTVSSDGGLDASFASQANSSTDDLSESPVEQTSHATFIAPALPPIRFSMNTADFSELLNSVGGLPSLKDLDKLATVNEHPGVASSSTPPPTATSMLPSVTIPTPSSQDTIFAQNRDPTKYKTDLNPAADRKPSLNGNGMADDLPNSTLERSISSSSANSFLDLDHHDTQGSQSLHNSLKDSTSTTRFTLTGPESNVATTLRHEDTDTLLQRLRDAVKDARGRGVQQMRFDREDVQVIIEALESRKAESSELKDKMDGMKRTSKQYIDGLTVAQTEYDQELNARRDAEAEITRLRVLLSGQAARLTALSGDTRRQEVRQQLSKELNDNLSGLEYDLSRLKAERDMTLAEVEELSVTKSASEPAPANLGRTLTKRLDNIKAQYQRELVPLTQQKEALNREIAELKAVRDVFLEETTVLNARNEELARLSAVYARRLESAPEISQKSTDAPRDSLDRQRSQNQLAQSHQSNAQPHQSNLFAPSLSSSTSNSSTIYDENLDPRTLRGADIHTPSKGKFIKWPTSKPKDMVSPTSVIDIGKAKAAHLEHNFQQLSVLRFTRCDHCGDKMWGSQLRCTACSTSIHVRCIAHVQISCTQQSTPPREEPPPVPMPPSMFGRDLVEQVHADSNDDERQVPIIVEKCIDAVEMRALDYEGIYRKTGGAGQSRAITHLFERGDYSAFDLRDEDRFNDVCSITSVLKTYFRSLPVPLLTYDLHDQFMSAIALKDPVNKQRSLLDLIDKLPNEYYYTLRLLMLHLHNVRQRCERNLMNARNLGVVFGPTLLRSRDPSAEFSDMAGKALFVEWLVDNAPEVFDHN